MPIKPTIGRRLWYWPGSHDLRGDNEPPMARVDQAQAFDAGVVYVWNDDMVNLSVIDHGGRIYFRGSVRLAQSPADRPPAGQPYCEWMPYQQQANQARVLSDNSQPGPAV